MSERDKIESEAEASVTRHEEEITGVETTWRGTGYARARKRVGTYRVREDVPREVEDVVLERRVVAADDSGKVETLPDGSISIPVFEEELVVEKRTVLKERVIVRKETVSRVERVETELRREHIEIEADRGVELEVDEPS
jgi:uncharacterized protein (TIGR02271 family)